MQSVGMKSDGKRDEACVGCTCGQGEGGASTCTWVPHKHASVGRDDGMRLKQ